MNKQKLLQLGKMILSCGLLYILLRSLSWSSLGEALLHARLMWCMFALIAALSVILLSAWRWQLLLKTVSIKPPRFMALVYYYFVSSFFNNFAPANLASDVLRVSVLYRQGKNSIAATGSVLLERVLSLAGLVGICLWALAVQPLPLILHLNTLLIQIAGLALVVGGCLFIWLWLHPPIWLSSIITKLRELCQSVMAHPYQFGQAILVTMLLHLATMFITLGTLQAVSVQLALSIQLAVYAVAALAIALPITIQGVGVREGIYLGLLGLVGVAPEHILAAMTLNYVILILFSIVGGILFWVGPISDEPASEDIPPWPRISKEA